MPEYKCANKDCPTRTGWAPIGKDPPVLDKDTVIERGKQEFECPVCHHNVSKRFTPEESGARTRKILKGMHRGQIAAITMRCPEIWVEI